MKEKRPLVSVIVCAHNEEKYVDSCLSSLLKALKGFESEVILVADRCTDRTVEKAQKYGVMVIEKTWKRWRNSYSEALQTGYLKSKGEYISIVDADIVVPSNFFRDLIPLIRGSTVSVAAHIVTYPFTLLNKLVSAWERTYEFTPLGKKPRGAARIVLKKSLDAIGGFRDVPTPDTDIDLRFEKMNWRSISTKKVKVYHIRQISLKTIINGQINRGRGRYALGISLLRTLGHSLLRLRPLMICGWLLEWRDAKLKDKPVKAPLRQRLQIIK